MLRRISISLSAVLLVSAALATGSAGAASVDAIDDPGFRIYESSLAVDDSGNGIVAWVAAGQDGDFIHYAEVSSHGRPGPVKSVSDEPHDLRNLDVAIDRTGHAVMAWESSALKYVEVDRRGRAGDIRAIARGGSPQVAFERPGRAVVLFQGPDGLMATMVGGKAAHGPVRSLEPSLSAEFAFDLHGHSGRAVINTGNFDKVIRVVDFSTRTLRSKVVYARKLKRNFSIEGPAIATGRSGASTVVWTEAPRKRRGVVALHVSAGGKAGPARDITNGTRGRLASSAQVIATGAGSLVAWSSRKRSGRRSGQILAARLDGHGRADRARALSSRSDARVPVLAHGKDGSVVVAWRNEESGGSCISLREVAGDRKLGPLKRIRGCPAADGPELATDGKGRSTLSWVGANAVSVARTR